MAEQILLAWIGDQDRDAADLIEPLEVQEHGLEAGDLGRILEIYLDPTWTPSRYVLLSAGNTSRGETYVAWLKAITGAEVEHCPFPIANPTEFEPVYEAALDAVRRTHAEHPQAELLYHFTPGTRTMGMVWAIIARTQEPGRIVQSFREHGASEVPIPFDLAVEYVPAAQRVSDRDLTRLASESEIDPSVYFASISARSRVMRELLADAELMARRNIPVLLLGESGTGKGVVARAIHRASDRADQSFSTVNCGAFPELLFESELFGHVKGAFTGADRDRSGVLRQADGGMVFLDEVGELPPTQQVKLLSFLQDGLVRPVGADDGETVDVRVIAATNRELVTEVIEGRFREDLYYRLAIGVLTIPPLRDRPGELSTLISELLEETNAQLKDSVGYEPRSLTPGAKQILLDHDWPGNVRELQNMLLRLCGLSRTARIDAHEVRRRLLTRPRRGGVLDRPIGGNFDVRDAVDDVRRHYVERALADAHGVKQKAALLIGLNNATTLSNWMLDLGV